MMTSEQWTIDGLSEVDALNRIGILIDLSGDNRDPDGTTLAFSLIDALQERGVPDAIGPMLHYFRANAWENRKNENQDRNVWSWEQPEIQEQILELQRAIRHAGFEKLHPVRRCQILTNLGNQLNTAGRFIEAITLWDRALEIIPNFAMALANRGLAFQHYAKTLYDHGHAGLFLVAAYDSLTSATSESAFFESEGYEPARARFFDLRKQIEEFADIEAIRKSVVLDSFTLGKSTDEKLYRQWCLNERLFINPLNDLGAHSIAVQDVLTLPSITILNLDSSVPKIFGFFKQMKQEYASARYLFFEGWKGGAYSDERPHLSDTGVLLYNTLDYPAYGIAVEKMRIAFRMAYSLFDKIGYFINSYFSMGHPEHQVSFRGVWHEKTRHEKPLLPLFAGAENWPLRGLFWLAKDIYQDDFKDATLPEAEALADIRNHLEHKYLSLHQGWAFDMAMSESEDVAVQMRHRSMPVEEFATRTIEVLKRVRGAMIYLSLAVHREEGLRRVAKGDGGQVVPMSLDIWEDDWKM